MRSLSPSIVRALTASLRDVKILTRDGAAVALARRYAALIEDAAKTAAELDALRADDEMTAAAIARLRARVDAQQVISDLGPKLLSALAALGMSPAARAATKGGTASGAGTTAGDALARLREQREQRSAGLH